MTPPFGNVLRRAREIRGLSAMDASRAAGISTAYLSKLENDAVKKPSPQILQHLGDALAIPYSDLMRLSGYLVPGMEDAGIGNASAALFNGITDEERDELIEHLAWYRARRKITSGRPRIALPA